DTSQGKTALLFVLLNSPMGKQEDTVQTLLQIARLTISEKALFLEQYGPSYLLAGQSIQLLLDLFAELTNSPLQTEKMHILFRWLDSSLGQQETMVETLLHIACLTVEEKALFLDKYGPSYLSSSKLTPLLLDMFAELANSPLQTKKMRVLFTWLD